MQSKFSSEYFVFLKSVGLIRRVTLMLQFSERFSFSQARVVGGREDPLSFWAS